MSELINKLAPHHADTLVSGLLRAASSSFPGGKTLTTLLFPHAVSDFSEVLWERDCGSLHRLNVVLSYVLRFGGDIAQLAGLGAAYTGQELAAPLYALGTLAKGTYNAYWLSMNEALVTSERLSIYKFALQRANRKAYKLLYRK